MSVNAMKIEKTNTDCIWLKPKYIYNRQSAAKLPTIQNDWKKVQRLSLMGVGYKRLASEVVHIRKDEDIVCSLLKNRG